MVTTGTSYHPISVDFLTSSNRINGTVMVPHSGISGVLSDSTSSILDISTASLSWLHLPNKQPKKLENARLVKSQVIAACASKREHLGSTSISGYSTIQKYRIQFTASYFELEGTLEWPGWFDFSALMGKNVREYIALYQVKYSCLLAPGILYESPAVLINRKSIDLLSFAKPEKIPAA